MLLPGKSRERRLGQLSHLRASKISMSASDKVNFTLLGLMCRNAHLNLTWQEYVAYQRSDTIKYNQMELSTHKIILEIRSVYKVWFVFCQFSWCTLYDSVLRLQGCLGRFAWAPFNISARGCKAFVQLRGCKAFIKLTMLDIMQRTAYPATDLEFLEDRQRACFVLQVSSQSQNRGQDQAKGGLL